MNLNLKESKINREIKILEIEGSIDAFTYIKIKEELSTLLKIGSNKIICNMKNVDYIGPAGLKMFLKFIKDARKQDGDIKLAELKPSVKKTFEFAGFDKLCKFYKNISEAEKDFLPKEDIYKKTIEMQKMSKNMYGKTMIGDETNLYGKTMIGDETNLYGKTMIGDETNLYEKTIYIDNINLKEKVSKEGTLANGSYDILKEIKKIGDKIYAYPVIYEIKNKLKEDSISKLYEGEEKSINDFSKQIFLNYIKKQFEKEEKFMEILIEDIKKASKIIHQNIVQIYNLIFLNNYYFIVIEYVKGITLSKLLEKLKENKRYFPIEVATFIIYLLCNALEYINNKLDENNQPLDITHGYINPENIIFTLDGGVKLFNFGIGRAKLLYDIEKGNISSEEYIAPEVIKNKNIDKISDIFSLGAIYYEMLTLEKPSMNNIIKPSKLNKKVNDIIEKIVMRALNFNKEVRFQNFQDISRQLEETLYSKGFNLTQITLKKFIENNITH